MSGLLMIAVGLSLGLAGVWSVRVAFLTAGFGATWLVAEAFGAGLASSLLISAAGGVLALVVAFLASNILFFAVGAIVGAVAGARLFVLLDQGETSVLLALVLVPAVAGCSGVLAGKLRQRFLGWATAIGGAALVISGLGKVAPGALGFLADSQQTWEQVVSAAAWVGLAVGGRIVQRRISRSRDKSAVAVR